MQGEGDFYSVAEAERWGLAVRDAEMDRVAFRTTSR